MEHPDYHITVKYNTYLFNIYWYLWLDNSVEISFNWKLYGLINKSWESVLRYNLSFVPRDLDNRFLRDDILYDMLIVFVFYTLLSEIIWEETETFEESIVKSRYFPSLIIMYSNNIFFTKYSSGIIILGDFNQSTKRMCEAKCKFIEINLKCKK